MATEQSYCFLCLSLLNDKETLDSDQTRLGRSTRIRSKICENLLRRKTLHFTIFKCLLHSCHDSQQRCEKQLETSKKLLALLESEDSDGKNYQNFPRLICSECEIKAEEIMKLHSLLEKVQSKLHRRIETMKKVVIANSVYGQDEAAKKKMEEMERWLQENEENYNGASGGVASLVRAKRKWLDSLIEFHANVFENDGVYSGSLCGYLQKCRLSASVVLSKSCREDGNRLSLLIERATFQEDTKESEMTSETELNIGSETFDEDGCFTFDDLELNFDFLDDSDLMKEKPAPKLDDGDSHLRNNAERKTAKKRRKMSKSKGPVDGKDKDYESSTDISPKKGKTRHDTEEISGPSWRKRKRRARYRCESCPAIRSNVFSFMQHLQSHETGEKVYECKESLCDDPKRFFSGKQLYDYHVNQHNDKSYFWSCKICGDRIPPATFQSHFKSHKTETIYNCEHCYHSCDSVKDFVSHRNLYHAAVTNKCLFCPRVFEKSAGAPARKLWVEHMYQEHGQSDLLIKCEYEDCKETFFLQGSLANHLNLHKERFVCQHCLVRCRNAAALKKHVQITHSKEKTVSCSVPDCKEVFVSKEAMEKHKIDHHQFPKWKCDQCDKEYTTRGGLNLHKNKNHKGREFPCDICGKVFNYCAALTKHKSTHGERNVICETCGFRTTSVFQLKKHLLIHSEVPKHACPHCPKRFNYTRALADHIRTHTGEKPFVCQYCSAAFAQKGAVQNHVKKVHEMSSNSSAGRMKKKSKETHEEGVEHTSPVQPPPEDVQQPSNEGILVLETGAQVIIPDPQSWVFVK